MGSSRNTWILTAIVLALVALSVWFFYRFVRLPDLPPTPPPLSSVEPAMPPAESLPDDSSAIELPPLDASDELVRTLVAELSERPELTRWLVNEELARRFVASVTNVAQGENPRPHLAFLDPGKGFRVEERGASTRIAESGFERYDLFIAVVDSLDTAGMARLYSHLEPLLEQAYAELGDSGDGFHAVLESAFAELLAAPVPNGPVELDQKVTAYAFADAELEALAPAQKQLLRMGPENMRRLQAKLRALQTALAMNAPTDGMTDAGID